MYIAKGEYKTQSHRDHQQLSLLHVIGLGGLLRPEVSSMVHNKMVLFLYQRSWIATYS